MDISKKILKAINEGVLLALSFDDDLPDTEDVTMHKVSNNAYLEQHIKEYEKKHYLVMLQLMLPDPKEVDKNFIILAIEWHEKYGATYNPHLDGTDFKNFVHKCIKEVDEYVNLNWIDTSEVTNMGLLFYKHISTALDFGGDISEWDVSNVKYMAGMFGLNRKFNGNLSKWDVSNVKLMNSMFYYSKFNNDSISTWDVHNVTDMQDMFNNCPFDGDISNWNVSSVTNMAGMFWNALYFNLDISKWNISSVTDMYKMFYNDVMFNLDLSSWNISKDVDTNDMFCGCLSLKVEYRPKGV